MTKTFICVSTRGIPYINDPAMILTSQKTILSCDDNWIIEINQVSSINIIHYQNPNPKMYETIKRFIHTTDYMKNTSTNIS